MRRTGLSCPGNDEECARQSRVIAGEKDLMDFIEQASRSME